MSVAEPSKLISLYESEIVDNVMLSVETRSGGEIFEFMRTEIPSLRKPLPIPGSETSLLVLDTPYDFYDEVTDTENPVTAQILLGFRIGSPLETVRNSIPDLANIMGWDKEVLFSLLSTYEQEMKETNNG